MKTIVFTLGFDVTSVIARLSEIGLQGRENLVFIVSRSDSPRALSAQKTVENHIGVLNSRGFKLTSSFLKLEEDASAAIKTLYYQLVQYDDLYVELSGGQRYFGLVTLLVCMLLRSKVKEVTVRLESDGSIITIPLFTPTVISGTEAKVLAEFRTRNSLTQRELETSIGLGRSNVSRTLGKLENMGLVVGQGNHPRNYRITALGEILLAEHLRNQ